MILYFVRDERAGVLMEVAAMTNVFKIKHVKEVSVYRTESSADKKSLLSQLRHVAEELAAKRRKEREGEHEQRKTLFAGGVSNSPHHPSFKSPLTPL